MHPPSVVIQISSWNIILVLDSLCIPFVNDILIIIICPMLWLCQYIGLGFSNLINVNWSAYACLLWWIWQPDVIFVWILLIVAISNNYITWRSSLQWLRFIVSLGLNSFILENSPIIVYLQLGKVICFTFLSRVFCLLFWTDGS